MRYSNDTLQFWTSPLSTTEEQRVENTVSMIKDAVTSYKKLPDRTIETFVQGSYANNTNVRQNSDVDICLMLTSTFYCNYVEGKTDEDYGYTSGSMTYTDYKSHIINLLKTKFGLDTVTIGNRSTKVNANSYHVNADIVPAFEYRDYRIIGSIDPSKYVKGIKFYSADGKEIVNYPQDHIMNGTQKNKDTNYAYKKLVRIMKHIRDKMVEAGLVDGDTITSFLIECLVWNVPNYRITVDKLWTDTVKDAIAYLWTAIKDEKHKAWREVSERLYLFHIGRKWTDIGTKSFLCDMYNYLDSE
jgi:hypothetical protein